jgi:ABC-type nickel/cobalt efflux system permease component RcnA
MLDLLVGLQASVQSAFTGHISAFAQTRDFVALLALLPTALVFGAVHALTPGHSKSLLASYLVGSGLSRTRGMATALILTVTHIGSAVIVALVANELVSRTITGAGRAPILDLVSRGTLVVIGVWLVVRALLNRPHVHGEGAAMGFVAGLVPCPLTLFIMFYAVSKGVPEAGLLFAAAMVGGVGAVLLGVALFTLLARDALSARIDQLAFAGRVLEGGAGVFLLAIAMTELLGR